MDTIAGQPEVPPTSQPPLQPAGPQPAPTALSIGGLPPTTHYQGKLPFAWAGVIASFLLFAAAILFSTAYSAGGVFLACYASIVGLRLGTKGLRVLAIVAGFLNLLPFVIFLIKVMS